MTIDFNLDFDSNTKETIFKFNDKHDNGKIIEYKFGMKFSPDQLDIIINGLQQWKEEISK